MIIRRRVRMDIFEVLNAISKRKKTIMHSGKDEHDALIKAELDVSNEYHISLFDIRKLVKA
jgi:hypothetical protein